MALHTHTETTELLRSLFTCLLCWVLVSVVSTLLVVCFVGLWFLL